MADAASLYPVWASTARKFSYRLANIQSAKAKLLTKQMREFADDFDTWSDSSEVSPDEKLRRRKVVGDYMTCYRDALDLFASNP